MKTLLPAALVLALCPLLAASAGATPPKDWCDKQVKDGVQTDWSCLPACPSSLAVQSDGSVKSAGPIQAKDAQMCVFSAILNMNARIVYPVLDAKSGEAAYRAAKPGMMGSSMPQEAIDGWKKFQLDKAKVELAAKMKHEAELMAAFPPETRAQLDNLFDNNKIKGPDGKADVDVKACGDAAERAGKDVNMTNALQKTCFTEKDGVKKYAVPSGVDCKTGKVSFEEGADRGTGLTALNSFRIASEVCSNASFATIIGKSGDIAPKQVGTVQGDNSRAMKFFQGQLNKFLADAKKTDSLPADAPTSLVEDGKRGYNTRRAILVFQAANHLPQTGVMDADTIKGLNDQYKSQTYLPKGFKPQAAPPPALTPAQIDAQKHPDWYTP